MLGRRRKWNAKLAENQHSLPSSCNQPFLFFLSPPWLQPLPPSSPLLFCHLHREQTTPSFSSKLVFSISSSIPHKQPQPRPHLPFFSPSSFFPQFSLNLSTVGDREATPEAHRPSPAIPSLLSHTNSSSRELFLLLCRTRFLLLEAATRTSNRQQQHQALHQRRPSLLSST